MELTETEVAELRYLARHHQPLWGGIYERGGNDPDVMRWLQMGLVRAVKRPYSVGKAKFSGGYVITDNGRKVVAASSGSGR